MNHPDPVTAPIKKKNIVDLPDDFRESGEETPADEFGDETQSNEERTAEEGLEQTDFIDPRGEDEHGDEPDKEDS